MLLLLLLLSNLRIGQQLPRLFKQRTQTLRQVFFQEVQHPTDAVRQTLGEAAFLLQLGLQIIVFIAQPPVFLFKPLLPLRFFKKVGNRLSLIVAFVFAGIGIATHIAECAGIADTRFAQDDAAQLSAQVEALASKPEGFAVLDETVEEPMKAAIRAAGAEGDSVGGMLETAILGLPAGIGEPYFDSVESEIAHLAFSVPAVKGIEFGTGFGFAGMHGSEANDAFRMTPEGAVVTATNHNAGINGGIANGMPVVFRTVVKPTPSIYKQQDTVDYLAKKDAQLSIQGRHDPCIVPRAAIVQTCAAALAVGDLLTARYGAAWMTHPTSFRKEDE